MIGNCHLKSVLFVFCVFTPSKPCCEGLPVSIERPNSRSDMPILRKSRSGAQGETQKLIFRDLSILETETLTFDSDGVVADGKFHGWDQIQSSQLSDNRQAEFDRLLRDIGIPLFRIRHRLANRDWHSLPEVAEPLYAARSKTELTDANRRNSYLICLAVYRGRMAAGKRAEVLLPFIEACEASSTTGSAEISVVIPQISGADLNPDEIENRFTTDLLPIWFDRAEARRNFAMLSRKIGGVDEFKQASDGELIYLASLSIAAGKSGIAKASLDELSSRSSTLATSWQPILQTEQEVDDRKIGPATNALKKTYGSMNGPQRALANYLMALQAGDNPDDFDGAVLDLLYIPANHGVDQPALAAAALHRAAEIATASERFDEAGIFKSELLNRYQNTYHGGLQISK